MGSSKITLSRVAMIISHAWGLKTPHMATHDPPSWVRVLRCRGVWSWGFGV